MLQIAPFLMAEAFPVGNQKLKIARIRTIDIRIIDLVDDAVAQRKPNAAASVVRGADPLFGGTRPARFSAWRAERDFGVAIIHD